MFETSDTAAQAVWRVATPHSRWTGASHSEIISYNLTLEVRCRPSDGRLVARCTGTGQDVGGSAQDKNGYPLPLVPTYNFVTPEQVTVWRRLYDGKKA